MDVGSIDVEIEEHSSGDGHFYETRDNKVARKQLAASS